LVESPSVTKLGWRLNEHTLIMVETLNLLLHSSEENNRHSGWKKTVNAKGNNLLKKNRGKTRYRKTGHTQITWVTHILRC